MYICVYVCELEEKRCVWLVQFLHLNVCTIVFFYVCVCVSVDLCVCQCWFMHVSVSVGLCECVKLMMHVCVLAKCVYLNVNGSSEMHLSYFFFSFYFISGLTFKET